MLRETLARMSCNESPEGKSAYLEGVQKGYDLSLALISVNSHHEMTLRFLDIIAAIPGITAVSSYEVFVRSPQKNESDVAQPLLFRRFPISLEEGYRDANSDIIEKLFLKYNAPFVTCSYDDKNYIFMRTEECIPSRVLLAEGKASATDLALLSGLHQIFTRQTVLLDDKERDALTHLLNRQSLGHTLAEVKRYYLTKKATKDSEKLSWLALMDIDHFKKINDKYGHLFGDEVLLHFSNLLEENMRYTDFIFRYGGEEFVVILNDTTAEGAKECFERFRIAVENFAFPSGGVTVSIGYTPIIPDKPSEQLIAEADKSVYYAKDNGRNQVISADQLASDGHFSADDVELF